MKILIFKLSIFFTKLKNLSERKGLMEQINGGPENQWVVFNSTEEFVETKDEDNFKKSNLIKELNLKIKQLEYESNLLKNSIEEKNDEIIKLKQANEKCILEKESLKKNLEEQKIKYVELVNKLFNVYSKLESSSLKNPKNNS